MESKCCLSAGVRYGRTVLSDCYCSAPFKVMRPFYDGAQTKVIIMTASAGILAGDHYDLRFAIGPGADVVITGQGYTKVFRTDEDSCRQEIAFSVAEGGALRYLPHPVIPFAGSDFSGAARADLVRDCVFVYSDIVSCGRVFSGELFQMKRYRSRLQVYLDGELVFLDNCLLTPASMDYRSIGFFDTYSHMGTLYLYTPRKRQPLLERIRDLPFAGRFGATCAKEGILIRALADSGEEIDRFFHSAADLEL
ncbi:MAG: urease accessory protein UreD [Oscillospiraceae bacterium]